MPTVLPFKTLKPPSTDSAPPSNAMKTAHVLRFTLWFFTASLKLMPEAWAAAPVNDAYANATNLGSVLPLNTSGTNVEATTEAGEIGGGAASVWFRWTAPASGFYDFRTTGAAFDTKLDVYNSTVALPTATDLLGQNDDEGGGLLHTSRVQLGLVSGQVVTVRVSGYDAAAVGTFPLAITASPTLYDAYANRKLLTGSLPVTFAANNQGATTEVSENLFKPQVQGTLWFTWTAPSTGTFRADTISGAALDTTLAVFLDNGSLPTSAPIASNDDALGGTNSEATFPATSGLTYAIQVGGFNLSRGSFTLTIDVLRPANDQYASRTVLPSSAPVTSTGTYVGASLQTGEVAVPLAGGGSSKVSVWYAWTAPTADYYQFDTLASVVTDTSLAVYSSVATTAPPTVANRLGYNDNVVGGSLRSRVILPTAAGQTYVIQVSNGNSTRGSFTLAIALALPPNDNYANRIVMPNTLTGALSGFNVRGTLEAGEFVPVAPAAGMQASVWYNWTAPLSGSCVVDTVGASAIDTVLAVYTDNGALPLAAALLEANDNAPASVGSRVTFTAVAGQKYAFQVGGQGAVRGTFPLNLLLSPIPQEIAVTTAADVNIPNGGTVAEVTAINLPHPFYIKVNNVGGLDLSGFSTSLTGTNVSEFSITTPLPAAIAGLQSNFLGVTCSGAALGLRTATLKLQSNDADESPYTIELSCNVLSETNDSDGDGLNDAAEVRLAALGFDWQTEQHGLVDALNAGSNSAGLFTTGQVQAMHVGTTLSMVDPITHRFALRFQLKKSTNLLDFTPFPFVPASTSVDGTGQVRFEFLSPEGAAFYRLGVE